MSEGSGQSNFSVFALGGLLVLWAGLVIYFYLPAGDASPEQLEATALTGADAGAREKAAAKLASMGVKSKEHMRRVLGQSKDADVRAAAIQGLGAIWDYDSMDTFITALKDESPPVRNRAWLVVPMMLQLGSEYSPNDPPAKVEVQAKTMEGAWKKMKGSALLEQWKKRLEEDRQKGIR